MDPGRGSDSPGNCRRALHSSWTWTVFGPAHGNTNPANVRRAGTERTSICPAPRTASDTRRGAASDSCFVSGDVFGRSSAGSRGARAFRPISRGREIAAGKEDCLLRGPTAAQHRPDALFADYNSHAACSSGQLSLRDLWARHIRASDPFLRRKLRSRADAEKISPPRHFSVAANFPA